MLDFILELTENILNEVKSLSGKDKGLIYNQVYYALNQTRSHINSTRINDTDKSSMILSTIWQRTSQTIKMINNPTVQQLARTIEEKSKYWSDTDSYDKAQFDRYNMRLTQVETTLNKLCK